MDRPPVAPSQQPPVPTDVVVIGAGPVGLFQVFQLGLLELRCHVIDALERPGGQPVALYPGKPIYDIPGLPVCTGESLTHSLLTQVAPFEPTWHLGETVQTLLPQPGGRFLLETSGGTRLIARAVVIAAGAGSFQPRLLKAPGLEQLAPHQLAYHPSDPTRFAQQRVVVVGGDDEALTFALGLSAQPESPLITLLHRRSTYQSEPALLAAFQDRLGQPGLQAVTGQIARVESHDGALAVHTLSPEGQDHVLVADALAVFGGLSPQLGPLAEWGLSFTRKQLPVDTATCATSTPGIFAVGDINTYPGKRKLIVCGFHECVLAAFGVHDHLHPHHPAPLLYTTSSGKLHRLLGVAHTQGT